MCTWQPSTVPTALIGLRLETRAAIADALARKVLSRDSDPDTVRTRAAFTQQAVDLVQLGDTKGAAMLLKVACELHPGDWMLANNYGFSLIPSDAESALRSLDRATSLVDDGSPVPVLEANKAVAMIRSGDSPTAKRLISARSVGQIPDDEAWMW